MIDSLTLKHFRRHSPEVEFDFTKGLNVLRGSNESGKSTLIEAVLYALGGAKVLRDTLAETVTWGHKESELHVKLVMTINQIVYTFTRSKAGAECNWKGGKVTGQSEVTAFAADLLGADIKTASALMLSGQNELRGALDAGPTGVSTLMSKLADFNLIDRLVESAQNSLTTGAEAPLKARHGEALQALEEAKTNAPDVSELQSLRELQATQLLAIDVSEKAINLELLPAFQAAEAALQQALASNGHLTTLKGTLGGIEWDIEVLVAQWHDLNLKSTRVEPTTLEAARKAVADAEAHGVVAAAYAKVQALPAFPEVFWDQPKESFDAELARVRSVEAALIQKAQAAQAEAKALRRNLIKGGKCPTCGHDSQNDEHVAELNAKIEADAQAQEKIHNDAIAEKNGDDVAGLINEMGRISKIASAFEKVTAEVTDRGLPVKIDHSTYPPRVTWTGKAPVAPDVRGLKAFVKKLEDDDNAAVRVNGQMLQVKQQLEQKRLTAGSVQEQISTCVPVDTGPLAENYNKVGLFYNNAVESLNGLKVSSDNVKRDIERIETAVAMHTQALRMLEKQVADRTQELKELGFNNTLVKKLRGLKPSITDHLWNTVLSAVSNYFSLLRGEQSVVTKDSTGFKVNGKSVESLSGSTVDVLALAIRVALTKTFIPHASFLVLDEPAHGCDVTRTGNVLGFLSSVGFEQTLLASHDELSEAVADNVIALEIA